MDLQMTELFTLFPHESGIVMRRGIEMGIVLSLCLLTHCYLILREYYPLLSSSAYPDVILMSLSAMRLICALPRPYIWYASWRSYVEARRQPTPQQVSVRLIQAYSRPSRLEKSMLFFYYSWLGVTSVILVVYSPPTAFAQEMWRHVVLNYASILLHRILCVGLFYFLLNSDIKRGVTVEYLDSKTRVYKYSRADTSGVEGTSVDDTSASKASSQPNQSEECAVCFTDFSDGDTVRALPCDHIFHADCIDVWLTRHYNRCPMCSRGVGSGVQGWKRSQRSVVNERVHAD